MTIMTRITYEIASFVLPASRYMTRFSFDSHCENNCNVYLTFDDGPDPEHTPRVLDQLNQLNAKATFFVLGEKAERHPELVHRILEEGHSIGTHSWSHLGANEVSGRIWLDDVVRARRCVEAIVGRPVKLFRPPYGELTPRTLISLMRSDAVIVHWSQDPKDFNMESNRQFLSWFSENQPFSGSIMLMHDSLAITGKNLAEACNQWSDEVIFNAIPMSQAVRDINFR